MQNWRNKVMEGKNFLRTYTMKCGAMGGGFEIGNRSSPTETALHISFSVEKSDAEAANTAKVQVWNLSDQNLKVLDAADCVLELKAGYGNNNALILVGNITHVSTSMDGADRMTELEVVDGRVELRESVVTVSFNGAVDCRDVYSYIAGQMGVAIVFADGLEYKVLPNGFSFVGQARTALQKIAECCGHVWTMQNQILQITLPGHPVAVRGYVLSSDTGLIGTPKRIVIGSNKENEKAQTGWEVEYLLNGAIGINDTVQLESHMARGYFRVHKVTFDGDNMEGDWVCTAQLLEISA
jgi:hypothetical protein